jgi:hypothetical protein
LLLLLVLLPVRPLMFFGSDNGVPWYPSWCGSF